MDFLSTVFEISATFSDVLHSLYDTIARLHQVAVNLV
jgi:hypothetical protein